MDGFTLLVTLFLVAIVVVFLAIGRYHPKSGAEVLDWKPTRSYEDEVQLEMEDVDQMIEAQNERRRRAGRPEISEDEVRAEVEDEQREQAARAGRQEDRAQGAGEHHDPA